MEAQRVLLFSLVVLLRLFTRVRSTTWGESSLGSIFERCTLAGGVVQKFSPKNE
jgi:hypothetical protein